MRKQCLGQQDRAVVCWAERLVTDDNNDRKKETYDFELDTLQVSGKKGDGQSSRYIFFHKGYDTQPQIE